MFSDLLCFFFFQAEDGIRDGRVTGVQTCALPIWKAATSIPIVMAAVGDPVGAGLVGSLARPGGNITGLSLLNPATAGKRVELVKEILPGATRLGVLGNPTSPWTALMVRERSEEHT